MGMMGIEPTTERLEQAYVAHRPALLAIAYRMLGTFVDAEDVVQEAFIRFRRTLESGERLDSERAYLTTVTTRLAIDHLRSARVRREAYVGPWLPEPAVEGMTDLADEAAVSDSLSTAFLVLLERLTPQQRAVMLLRDVFGYEFDEIADMLDKTPGACRQLAVRARRHIHAHRPVRPAGREERARLAGAFFGAARAGDMDTLVDMLTHDAEFTGDGGDSRRGVSRPVRGRQRVAKVMKGLAVVIESAGITLHPVTVGSQPGVLLIDSDEHLIGVWSLVLSARGAVQAVHGMVNPDKLGHLGVPINAARRASRDHPGT